LITSLRRPISYSGAAQLEWIAIISAINLLLSLLILYKFHFSVAEFISHLGDNLKALFGGLLLEEHRPSIRVTPI
jgi:hypothetical protein